MIGMEKNIVFFDIDGTIWDHRNYIPPSAAEAIQRLRANGHLAFLCSGRTRGFIRHPDLLALGFDGIVSGCGTMLEYGGETLFYHRVDPALALKAVTTARRHGFRLILEGVDYLYLDRDEFDGDLYGEKLVRDMGPWLRSIRDCWGRWEFSKFSCDTAGCDQAACFAELPEFHPIVHNAKVVEMVPKGFDKASGILRICELLGRDVANAVAFGDGINDLGMFSVCGTSVCMGNGVDEAKRAADLVAPPMLEDGLLRACQTLGLI